MTMDAMCGYLSARGFVAEKKYDKSTQSYRFAINKDGWILTKYFKYPIDVKPAVRDRIQREFLEEMIDKFNKDVANFDPITHLYPQSMIVDDILKNRKGEEMGTRRINWNVERTETEMSMRTGEHTQVRAVLTGYLDPLFVGDVFTIKDDLQKHLDKYMTEDDRTMYVTKDIANTRELWSKQNPYVRQAIPSIKNVVFNDPATIVFWADGSKTIVKCQNNDIFDPEKGLAMAITKKVLGNQGNYCNEIKKWLPKENEEEMR